MNSEPRDEVEFSVGFMVSALIDSVWVGCMVVGSCKGLLRLGKG